MLDWLRGLFRGRGIVIEGTGKLAEGHSKKIDVGDPLAGGKQVVLCRVGGKLFALDALCPHEGGRIHDGPLAEGKYAVCPLHNYKFDPRTGASVEVACKAAKRYQVAEEGGNARLWA
ncbi:MAG: Rieske (2Fe-2S) protein [Planctomycetes bacterium]|nr:Rieske (2Fe-2S) protein [Planctomycetota bacterium]